MPSELVEELKKKRVDKMRNGKAACDIRNLLSEPDIRVALIPLTEGEYDAALQAVAEMQAPENVAGASWRDRREQCEVLVRAIRNPVDLTERPFETVQQLMDSTETYDINHLYDAYLELQSTFNVSIEALPEDELGEVKKVFENLDWNALSGKQWYALTRFLSTLSATQLLGNSLGSTSIN
jgi:hypothetical protein